MTTQSPQANPFGPDVQKYWDRRYLYFSKFDEGIQIDKEGLYSVTREATALEQATHVISNTIYDAFGGVGGNAIALARSGKTVVVSELNPGRAEMCRNNATVYGVGDSVGVITGDFFDVVGDVEADAVILDPPWGGVNFKELPEFLLEHFTPDGHKILEACLGKFKEIILKVPATFRTSELDQYADNYEVFDNISNGEIISKTVIIRQP